MSKDCHKEFEKVFLNTIKNYQAEGKAVFTPLTFDHREPQEYMGTVRSGKLVYFAFVNEMGNNIEDLHLTSFLTKAKEYFQLGGIVFAIFCYKGKTYRIPYFVLESLCAGKNQIDESAIKAFEFETNSKQMNFLKSDVFECTIAAKSSYLQRKAS